MKIAKKFGVMLLVLTMGFVMACGDDDDNAAVQASKEQAIQAMIKGLANGAKDQLNDETDQKIAKATQNFSVNATFDMDYEESGLSTTGTMNYTFDMSYDDITNETISMDISMDGTITAVYDNFNQQGYIMNGTLTQTIDMDGSGANMENMTMVLTMNGTIEMTGVATGTIVFTNLVFTINIVNNVEKESVTGTVTIDGEEVDLL